MKLDAVARQPADAGFGGRFYLVSYLPTYAAALFLLVLAWAGALGWAGRPGHRIRFTAAWATASHLSLGEVALIALAVALLAVLLQPLQCAMMSAAQGSWPPWPGTRWALRWQKHRRNRLAAAARLPQGPDLTDAAIQRAGAAGHQLRRRFPRPDHLLQPTALGNVLAAMHDSAGRAYGLDAVTAWPRLYPVLGESARTLVDDRRDTLDGSVRMTATMTVTAIASLVLLACSGWWILLALIPLAIAVLAYNAAVQAALAYAETVHVAFDLHRADLLTALRMEPPRRQDAERALNEHWCDLWRQGIPLPATLEYATSTYSRPNPSASISSASAAPRPEVEAPTAAKASRRRGALGSCAANRSAASWSAVWPRRAASAASASATASSRWSVTVMTPA